MASKRAPFSKAGAESKRQRRMMTITEKVKLLDMLKEGKSFMAVTRQYDVKESTVRCIKKEDANIRKTATITFYKSAKRVVTACNKTIIRMKEALALWIADCRKKNIPLDSNIIQTKAMSVRGLCHKEPEDDSGNREEDVEEVEEVRQEMALPPEET